MDTTKLGQTLTCAEAIEWLQGTLNDPDNEDLDPTEAMSTILERDWKSEEEFLEFFKEISIELAKTACESWSEETARLFDREVGYSLNLWSPYYKLWEKAFNTKNPALKEPINIQEWDSEIPPETEELEPIQMIPLAMAYECPILEGLRNRTIEVTTTAEEEFLAWFAVSLEASTYDMYPLPTEIVNIPSSKVLAEIFEDWSMYKDIWDPMTIKMALDNKYADENIKSLIARVLRGESDYNPEEWEEHREEYWSDEEIEKVLSLCEEPQG
jgi:hypothetical protein